MDTFSGIGQGQMTIIFVILAIVAVWDAVWKVIALWHSARRKQLAWFILIAIFNTVGILPIIYLLVNKDRKEA